MINNDQIICQLCHSLETLAYNAANDYKLLVTTCKLTIRNSNLVVKLHWSFEKCT